MSNSDEHIVTRTITTSICGSTHDIFVARVIVGSQPYGDCVLLDLDSRRSVIGLDVEGV